MVDTYDAVIDDLAGSVDEDTSLLIAGRLEPEQWYQTGMLWLEGEELLSVSWHDFAHWILDSSVELEEIGLQPTPEHWMGEQADGILPSLMLPRLIEVLESSEVIKFVPSGRWHRATQLTEDEVPSASRLGTAPPHRADRPNRFSERGKPWFYGAADCHTAVLEIDSDPTRQTFTGEWIPSRPLRVVDLTQLPPLPSIWDHAQAPLRQLLLFLSSFAKDVSKRVPSISSQREYRPTQAVSYSIHQAGGIDGILYSSSKTGEPCCILFVDNEHCVESPAAVDDRELYLSLAEVVRHPGS